MDRIQAMQTFVAIVNGGSLTAAAESLDRSLPTVVRMLAALEAHLGARLLRRTTRTMSLTVEGARYLERCKQILADIDDAEAELGDAMGVPSGHLQLTAPVLFGQMHVAPLVTQFLLSNRGVDVNLILADRTVDLVDDGIDLAVRIGPLRDSSMVALPLASMRRVVCASPDYLARCGFPESPSDPANHRGVRFHQDAARSAWLFAQGKQTQALRIQGSLTCNHAGAAAAACADGLGLGQFFAYQVATYIDSGALRIVLQEFEQTPFPVSLLYPHSRVVSRRLRVLLEFLKPRLSTRLDAISQSLQGAPSERRERS